MNADGENFKNFKQINDYFTNLFYFTSKLRSYEYEFRISKIKEIFYKGKEIY
jgi:hypothetical protein